LHGLLIQAFRKYCQKKMQNQLGFENRLQVEVALVDYQDCASERFVSHPQLSFRVQRLPGPHWRQGAHMATAKHRVLPKCALLRSGRAYRCITSSSIFVQAPPALFGSNKQAGFVQNKNAVSMTSLANEYGNTAG
jgi:hypothetical protein